MVKLVSLIAVGGLVLSSLTGGGTLAKSSEGTDPSSDRVVVAADSQAQSGPLRYEDVDIVEFFVWGQGRVAQAHPELLDTLGIEPQGVPAPAVLAKAVADFAEVDEAFHENVTVALQSRDPYRAEAGISNFASDLKAILAEAPSGTTAARAGAAIDATANGSVIGSVNYVFWTTVAVSAALALALAAVASVAVVLLALYQSPADESNLIAQTYVAALAEL